MKMEKAGKNARNSLFQLINQQQQRRHKKLLLSPGRSYESSYAYIRALSLTL